ncbi:EamA family transporter [Cryobacterium sp. BB736]|uniref:EamA family transporter n=1 Tax=Cryobacterium sp. BB736 TaxID=2746963 RepID=UPI0018737571
MGYFWALLAALLFGVNGSVTKVLVEGGLSAAHVTLFRVAGTALIAAIVLLVSDRKAFRITLRQAAVLAVLGVFGVALLQFTYAVAVSLVPVGIALLIEYMAVLIVALFAFFVLRERVRARLWVAIGFVLIGLALVARVWNSDLNPLGVLMASCAAVALALYFLLGEREVGKSSPMAVGFWSMSFAALFWVIFGDLGSLDVSGLGEAVPLGGHLEAVAVPLWMLVAWNVVLGSFAPFLLSLLALRYLTATAAGITASAEVIFAFAFAWVWLGELLTPLQLVGAAVVLVGIVLAQTARINKVVDPDLAIIDQEARIT